MDAQQLIDRLEERAAEIPVGPPPVALMRARARRHRQGRLAVLAAAAAVAVIGAGAALPGVWGGGGSGTSVATDPAPAVDTPPDGFRYVGAGSVVAAVPEEWGTNEVECGTPVEDTVVIDQGATCLMLVVRPADVDSLAVGSSRGVVGDTAGWTETDVEGEPALRSPVTVEGGLARQSVLVPSADTVFVAESSSADGTDVVGAILDSLTVLQAHTTVPGFQDLAFQRGGQSMVDGYVDRLDALGLAAAITDRNAKGFPSGMVLETIPAVGEVIDRHATVQVVVAR